VFLITLD